MDDFGIGSSNFDRVAALRPDIVKIDKSVLSQSLGRDKAGRALPVMVELLHELGARVAVEGIETRAGAVAAIAARADYVQGFHFARPGPSLATESSGFERLDQLLHPTTLAAA
jgi:EAL domain-containing protein (putative c-di-GMP-specific phosphodiesterase class I)